MSYNIETTELYLCHYYYDNIMSPSHVIKSKKEIQDDIRRNYARTRYQLPNKIERLNVQPGEEVTLKEFVPKNEQKPVQKSIYESSNIWNAIWNGVEYKKEQK